MFKKKTTKPSATKPAAKPKNLNDKMRADYQLGVNHQQLAEKYDVSVEKVTEVLGV